MKNHNRYIYIIFSLIILLIPAGISYADDADDILTLVNAERAAAGVAPLTLNTQLDDAARRHALDMIANDFFSHTGSDCSTPFARISETGYRYSASGENIAWGYHSAAEVMDGWMSSPGHRANILRENFTEMGLVRIGVTWVQTFGRPGSGQGHYNSDCTPLPVEQPVEYLQATPASEETTRNDENAIPAIELPALASGTHLNADDAAWSPVSIFCNGDVADAGLAILRHHDNTASPAISLTAQTLSDSLAFAQQTGQNQFITSAADVTFWALTTGELQVQANEHNNPASKYNFIFKGDSCGTLPLANDI